MKNFKLWFRTCQYNYIS